MSFVLDSSVALSWCFRDEQTPESLRVLNLARAEAVFVPALWHIEMANVLGMAFRRGRLDADDLSLALKMLAALEMHTDATVLPINTSVLLPMMQTWSLTSYDAVYLEMTLRQKMPLATLDTALASAASQAGAVLLCRQ